MGEVQTDVALNVFEITGVAWALTVHKAAETLAHGSEADLSAYLDSINAQAILALDSDTVEMAEAELGRAGIVDGDGAISRQWVLAVWISAFAPIRAAAVLQGTETSVHTELALSGGRGVGLTYVRDIRPPGGAIDVTENRNAVEITFFAEENAWAALKRHLPDLAGVPEATRLANPPAAGLSEIVARARYTIHLDVSARPSGSRPAGPVAAPDYLSRDVWALAERLYSVTTGPSGEGFGLTPVPSDAIGHGLAWRLLGAREYLASVAGRVA
ncbi:MAG: hypothetical protein JWQ56_3880 [Pseudarthrobacter sp.]|nr:hypothetical protein [Pseudarthrobacter sp.]